VVVSPPVALVPPDAKLSVPVPLVPPAPPSENELPSGVVGPFRPTPDESHAENSIPTLAAHKHDATILPKPNCVLSGLCMRLSPWSRSGFVVSSAQWQWLGLPAWLNRFLWPEERNWERTTMGWIRTADMERPWFRLGRANRHHGLFGNAQPAYFT
jgi:hypothetical protein